MAASCPAEAMGGDGSAPAYRRVKDHVLGHILAGHWTVGERIPSEHDLKDQFGVSRMTVNRALRELTEEGYVSRTVGAGTYVADRPAAGATIALRDIADAARDAGRRCRTHVVAASAARAAGETARRLFLSPGAPIFCVTRVQWVGNTPIQLEERWVNAALAPSFLTHDFAREAPTTVLARLVPHSKESHEVHAVAAKGKAKTLLAMQTGEPCLLVTSVLSVDSGVLSVANLHHPGSSYALPGRFL